MSRVQLALRVSDLEGSVAFYSKLFGAEPAKRRPGYANFAIEEPPLKLVLIEGEADQPTVMDHLGVEVFSSDEVMAATSRLTDAGLVTLTEDNTECCYALQGQGLGARPWPGALGGLRRQSRRRHPHQGDRLRVLHSGHERRNRGRRRVDRGQLLLTGEHHRPFHPRGQDS
jgi:catechol 2,3-dioxygenase-like lactoylglutathione lyase family enzyme